MVAKQRKNLVVMGEYEGSLCCMRSVAVVNDHSRSQTMKVCDDCFGMGWFVRLA
jgi:hypothetical protein